MKISKGAQCPAPATSEIIVSVSPTAIDIIDDQIVHTYGLKPLGSECDPKNRICCATLKGRENHHVFAILTEEMKDKSGNFTCEYIVTVVRIENGVMMSMLELPMFLTGGFKEMFIDPHGALFIRTGMKRLEITDLCTLQDKGFVRQDEIPFWGSADKHPSLSFLDGNVTVSAPQLYRKVLIPVRQRAVPIRSVIEQNAIAA